MGRWLTGAALCALGYLSHGGAMFSLLALAPLTLFMRPTKTMLVASLGIFLLLVLPWSCYQKFYDPPGNRLLKWHLAGVIPIDNRGAWETISTSYHKTSWSDILQNKGANVAQLFQDGPWHLLNLSPANVRDNRAAEFFHFFRALGLGSWLLLLLPWLAWRLRGDKSSTNFIRFSSLLAGWVALTLLVWVSLSFGPGTTIIHSGSLAPLLVLWTLPVVVLARWWRPSLVLVAIIQLVLLIAIWLPANPAMSAPLSVSSLLLVLSSTLLLGLLIIFTHREHACEN
jgi:hypothetical protein